MSQRARLNGWGETMLGTCAQPKVSHMRHIFSALFLAGLVVFYAAGHAPYASGAGKSTPAAEAARQGSRAAAGGCDGVKNGNFGFHTDKEENPWWQVDLGKVQPLDRVVVWNRCGTAAERAAHLLVLLSSDGKAWQQAYQHDGSIFHGVTDQKPLTAPLKGAEARFVRVQLADDTWLHLDEVEVFGQADPKVNIALRMPADQSSVYGKSAARAAPAAPAAEGKAAPKRGAAAGGPVGAPTEANRQALRRAIDDLMADYPDKYVRGSSGDTSLNSPPGLARPRPRLLPPQAAGQSRLQFQQELQRPERAARTSVTPQRLQRGVIGLGP